MWRGCITFDKRWDQLPSATVPFERSLIDTAEKRMVVMFSRQKSEKFRTYMTVEGDPMAWKH